MRRSSPKSQKLFWLPKATSPRKISPNLESIPSTLEQNQLRKSTPFSFAISAKIVQGKMIESAVLSCLYFSLFWEQLVRCFFSLSRLMVSSEQASQHSLPQNLSWQYTLALELPTNSTQMRMSNFLPFIDTSLKMSGFQMYFWASLCQCLTIESQSLCRDMPTPLELVLLLVSHKFSLPFCRSFSKSLAFFASSLKSLAIRMSSSSVGDSTSEE